MITIEENGFSILERRLNRIEDLIVNLSKNTKQSNTKGQKHAKAKPLNEPASLDLAEKEAANNDQ